ncbi:MAG TPA: FGGY family carbohydrate kinase, partial [Solimonas sp.]
MTEARLLSIDVGTQSVRAIVFDAQGRLLAKAQQVFEPTYHSPQPGWAEQDPELYWQSIAACCGRLWEQGSVRPEQISGISLTTQRATVVCLDAAGQPLRPAILWLDQRRCDQPPPMGPVWNTLFGLAGATDLIAHLQGQAEANWLAQHEPQLWRDTAKFLLLSGWLSYRLTGEYLDSVGSQVGFIPFDYKRLDWASPRDFKWKALAIRPEQLPRLVPPGAPMGRLSAAAAAELGLPANVPVIAAAADKACEVLGCGVLEPDVGQLSFGTTATINTTQSRYIEVQRMLPPWPAGLP